ncbi:rho GTPase-activating protein 21-like isoform X2 [Diprion similis]|uniref:rho GTPase-activating protein 21-like isoform X2 n=1 Tax=Diprion similis TaxID=362088 RepID=UPI001EF9431B|nr:rho GTPase-activating protein 21-like isoform X2 [Diprion similis]
MFVYDVLDKEKVYQILSNDLRNLGVKRRIKKQAASSSSAKPDSGGGQSLKKVFKTSLAHLPLDVVKLSSGAIVHVPQFVSQACSYIEKCGSQEGIFRKAGSHLRQKEIIARLDAGCTLGEKYQVVDVANVLKTFFRDLPDPLIPRIYQDVFLRCALLKNSRVQALLIACLILPPHHLNTLAYLAEFLKRIARLERQNKMGIDNLAKVMGPSIMPLQETTMSAVQSRLETHLVIVKILIENAERIGVLPDHVADLIASETPSSVETELNTSDFLNPSKNKKKKRRSGSLTRMLNGLKKMVSKSGSPDAAASSGVVGSEFSTADTPSIKTGKKRKVAESAAPLSAKKKRQVLQTLPDGGYPRPENTMFASIISNDPNPCKEKSPVQKSRVRKYLSQKVHIEITGSEKLEKTKKIRLSLDRLVSKSKQKQADLDSENHNAPNSPRIERRWSSMSSSSWSKKNRVGYDGFTVAQSLLKANRKLEDGLDSEYDQDEVFMDAEVNLSDENTVEERISEERMNVDCSQAPPFSNFTDQLVEGDEEYVTIPKSEYEEIKNRVSAIESRISQEFGCISTTTDQSLSQTSASKVQSEYEKTLEEASIGSTVTADQLAKRLSRELKIRRSAEHKIIRSPSARKIGNLRRRSQEKPVGKRSSRHVSWLVSKPASTDEPIEELNNLCPKSSLKRGRPNTVYTGLSQRSQLLQGSDSICSDETNARLDFLQKQLHALITHTVEHTKGSLSDDDTFLGDRDDSLDVSDGVMRPPVRRASSFHGAEFIDNSRHFNEKMKELKKSNSQQDFTLNNERLGTRETAEAVERGKVNEDNNVNWRDADCYFGSDVRSRTPAQQTGRASIAKLRTQNAGMVLAKARLFDETSKKDASNGSNKSRDVRTDAIRRQSVKVGRARETKSLDGVDSPSGLKKTGGTPRRKHSKSPKNSGAKLKLLHSTGTSPLIKMELTIMPSHQNAQQGSEKRSARLSGEKCEARRRLETTKNDVKTERSKLNKSLYFNSGNNFHCEKENKNLFSPNEKQKSPDCISKEINRNMLNVESLTPCKTPHIKRPLTLKTPKDAKNLMRKQCNDSRRTPMKAVALTTFST